MATDLDPQETLAIYGLCWGIERLFAAFKGRGFDLEGTHLVCLRKLARLLMALSLAFVWAFRTRVWIHQVKPVEIKRHGRLARSLFRLGLDYLQRQLLALLRLGAPKWPLNIGPVEVLTCT